MNHEYKVHDRQYEFCTVVSEVSSFVGNPVHKTCKMNRDIFLFLANEDISIVKFHFLYTVQGDPKT